MSRFKPDATRSHTLYMRVWRGKNQDFYNKYQRDYKRSRRESVINYYGGKCACCGELHYEFLAIDHMNGGGEKHRREVGQGDLMVAWIINNDFPVGFRILCHNCYQAIGFHGFCPHQGRKLKVVGEK